MHRKSLRLEKRSQRRNHRSDTIAWRPRASTTSHLGLLLESSDTGYAFAWRGPNVPQIDAIIHLDLHPDVDGATSVLARVRRVTQVHDDLVVIAAEVWDPKASLAIAATETVPTSLVRECKPVIRERLSCRIQKPPAFANLPDAAVLRASVVGS